MADISSYIAQIQNAIYGRDVRSSFVSALTLINDDHNDLIGTRTEILDAYDQLIASANTLTSLLNATSAANTSNDILVNTTAAADASKAALDHSILGAASGVNSIQEAIDSFDEQTYIGEVGQRLENLETAALTHSELTTALIDAAGTLIETDSGFVLGSEDAAPWKSMLSDIMIVNDYLASQLDAARLRVRVLEDQIKKIAGDTSYLMDLAGTIEGKCLMEV